MRQDPTKRHKMRLSGFDYSGPGPYFVTLVTEGRLCLFGEVIEGKVHLSAAGKMLQETLAAVPQHYPDLVLDCFVVMPNHLHLLVGFTSVAKEGPIEHRQDLGSVVRKLKTLISKQYGEGVRNQGWPPYPGHLFQLNYWDEIVRDEIDLERKREYIWNNPAQWTLDELNGMQ